MSERVQSITVDVHIDTNKDEHHLTFTLQEDENVGDLTERVRRAIKEVLS